MNKFFKLLFSFNGRIGVGRFWLATVLEIVFAYVFMIVVVVLTALADKSVFEGGEKELSPQALAILIGGIIVAVVVLNVMQFATMVKRCHDRDKSGWYSLLTFIPLFGFFWWLIELGIRAGIPGPNQYGPDPRAPAPAPSAATLDTAEFRELKILADNGLIGQAEYERRKRKLLGI